MKIRRKRMKHLVISLAAVLVFVASLMTISFAAEANESVNNARTGVVQVRTYYQASDGVDYDISWGTGFLINETTVMTCHHVIYPSADDLKSMRELFGIENKTDKQILEKMSIKVTVYSDSSVSAEIAEGVSSENGDFVALKLKTPLTDYKPIPIRNTKENPVSATEACYVLGFPYKMVLFKYDKSLKFDQEAIEVTPGTVKKMDDIGGIKTIIMSDTLASGYSGGPMVDTDGNVIGIATSRDSLDDNQSYATASQEFLPVLTTLGVDFTSAQGAVTATEPNNKEENTDVVGPTDENTEEKKEETKKSEAKPEKTKSSALPYILGGIGVVALLGILAAVLISRGKKKNDPLMSAGQTYTAGGGPVPAQPVTGTGSPAGGAAPVVPPAASGGYAGAPTPDTSVLNQGSNETTVLGQGAGETSVLAGNQDCGTLTREKTGEKITINRDNFKIGRERSRVDYCISDNTAVGRHHATIVTRGGESYIVDEKSRNFTFVNDVKATPHEEIKLKDGDKISLGDEIYVFYSK